MIVFDDAVVDEIDRAVVGAVWVGVVVCDAAVRSSTSVRDPTDIVAVVVADGVAHMLDELAHSTD